MAIDQFSDPALARLSQLLTTMPSLEGFVKTASMDPSEVEALPPEAFADPETRRFPLHSAEHAALSYAYSKVAADTSPAVTARIVQALEIYQVPETAFETVKVATEEDPSAWLSHDLHLFQVKTSSEVSSAQHEFLENYEKFDVPHRRDIARNLVKKAAEFGVVVRPHVLKVAGLTVSHLPTLRQWVHAREDACPKQEHKSAYAKFASALRYMGEESADSHALMKVAQGLEELDARAGLDRHYDRRLPDPLLTVFNTTKVASGSIDVDGVQFSPEKLASLPVSFWEDLGGKDLSDEVAPGGVLDQSKLATVVSTLPLDLKRVLRSHLRG